ncbi:ADP-ribosylation factor family-domain-containing protein [Mycena capillaripes]|nr:ADP-ribosylation factor family-domain-containing protein [Mycena capillaripes]
MSLTAFRRLIDRFYPRPANGYKIPLLGIDSSGKTTLLYRLKLGEIVQTIPTIGFNVEKIQVRVGKSGRLITMLCWDAGGCSNFTPTFLRPYTSGSDALIWVVDGCDRERISESSEELALHIRILTSNSNDPGNVERRDLPHCDETRSSELHAPRKNSYQIRKATAGSPYFIIGTTLTQSITEAPFLDAFTWLLTTIEEVRAGKSPLSGPESEFPHPHSPTALESKLDEWLARAEKSEPSTEQFLRQFETFSLPAWDHYTHIRITYLLLTIHGRQKAFDLASNSDASTTQTLLEDEESLDKETAAEGDKFEDGFSRFLLTNPHLADGDLWSQYYSKEVMMSPQAKAAMVFPDKKPLPNLVARETVSSVRRSKEVLV